MRRGLPGFGRFVELQLVGRRTGRPRPVILTLLVLDGRWYVGHPDGAAPWVRNLQAAGAALLVWGSGRAVRVRAVPLEAGPERDRLIRATAWLQPFPASLLYRAARRHILAVGAYLRLEAIDPDAPQPATQEA
jgi:hypothetical protein